MKRLDVAETAITDIAFALQEHFESVAFSVRRVPDLGNNRYVIKWADGPSKDEIQAVTLPCIREVPKAKIYCLRTDRPHPRVT
jgi:hypothetical protein